MYLALSQYIKYKNWFQDIHFADKGSLTNFVDKTSLVSGTENVNDTVGRLSLIPVKEFLYNCQPEVGGWSKKGQNLVNLVQECPPKN